MTELEQIPVTALLPQQPPFIMIDALTDCSEKETATRPFQGQSPQPERPGNSLIR